MIRATDWPEDRVQVLRTMFAGKHSATEIAAAIGGGLSRNAVCGKLARLGLVRGWGPRHPDKPVAKKRARAIRKHPLPPGAPKFNPEPFICAEAVDIEPRHLAVLELADGLCKYPFGNGPFTFCGLPTRGKTYCRSHHQLCYQGIPERRQALHPAEFGKNRGGVFGRVA